MSHHDHCPHCRASLPARHSRLAGALVLGLAWVTAMAMVFGGILLGPAIMIVLPVLLPGGICLVTAAHEFASGDRICERCGKLVEAETAKAPLSAEFTTAGAA